MNDMKRLIPFLLILLLLPVFGVRADGEGELMVQGDEGEEVVRIQTRLFDLGYYTYKPTGSFRTVTKSAVVSYQVAAGLMSDGSVGRETLSTLFSKGAPRVPFRAEIPLRFTAQGMIVQRGSVIPWSVVREQLVPGESYSIRNAATGEDVTLVFDGGENHAELSLPAPYTEQRTAVNMLTSWLGDTNSFYKCAVLLERNGQWIAASLQWNGTDRACLYCSGSLSHVQNLPDVEHEANIKKAGY